MPPVLPVAFLQVLSAVVPLILLLTGTWSGLMDDSLANTEAKDSDPDCTIPETKVEDVELSTSDNPSADGHSEDVDIPTTVSECMVTNVENQADCDADLAAASEFDADADNDENEGDDDIVNVIIKPSGKGGIYKTGATYQARSVSHTVQRK
ncbi:unnamed protein product [Dicrocoelium dendriticum]|nr:unnamed protein product [Dicrocoelium dendriticum]